tara:strand:- start:241 stop:498 length:258 start_codon:yes stop_codon:yes gene_type:complete
MTIKVKKDSWILKSDIEDKKNVDVNKNTFAYYSNIRDYFIDAIENLQYDNNEEQSHNAGLYGNGFGISFKIDNAVYSVSMTKEVA